MQCCASCFGDKGLRDEIIPQRSTQTGDCPTCGSRNQALVDAVKLGDYFELLTSIYRPDNEGRPLVQWLIDDWALFPHPDIDEAKATLLLAEVLDDGEIVRAKFSPSEACKTDHLDQWEQLRIELKHRNRFFPETELDSARLEDLLSRLLLDKEEEPEVWFRARIEEDGQPYESKDMGAPPEHVASHGRANPAGIPYLYLGSNHQTAVSEIRPHPGEEACVAEFTIGADLKIVDLRQPRSSISPFLALDENDVALLRGDIDFLERLGEELTTPVLPTAAAIDYIPSQFLCEFIKKCGFHGVAYRSSVSSGMNLALFDPKKAQVGETKEYTVARVSVEIDPIENPIDGALADS